jgi:hypothetical protein
LFPPPAIFWTETPVRGVFTNLDMMHVCGPSFAQASKDYAGADFIGTRTNFSAEEFARMLAKIGFCAAIASVGLGAFTNTPIRKVILGTDQCFDHLSAAAALPLNRLSSSTDSSESLNHGNRLAFRRAYVELCRTEIDSPSISPRVWPIWRSGTDLGNDSRARVC